MRSRVVILCESYGDLPYVLYKIETESMEVPITIFITALSDLLLLLQDINEKVYNNRLELIYYPPYSIRRGGVKRLQYIIPDILGERRHLKQFYNRYFRELYHAEVFYQSAGYTGVKIYTLTRMQKNNKLIYVDPGYPYMGKYSPRSLRDFALLIYYKVLYGKNTTIGQFPVSQPVDTGFAFNPKLLKIVSRNNNGT